MNKAKPYNASVARQPIAEIDGSTGLAPERKRAVKIEESQRQVLQLMAEDAPLGKILDALIRTMEVEATSKMFGSILLLDEDGIHLRLGAAPSLPPAYKEAIDGIAAGSAVGAFEAAPLSKTPFSVADIATDPLWAQLRELALSNRLRVCWSTPIVSTHGNFLGTLAFYHPEPRQPNGEDLTMVETAARTASIAIERKLSDAKLREGERRYRQLVRSLPAAVYTTDGQGRVTIYNEAAAVLWGRRPEVGKDLWCGSCRIYRPDGTPLALDECPMAVTLREGRPVRGEEIIIERPDGTRRNILPYPDSIRDRAGRIVGAVNMLLDITDSKRAEEASRRLAAIVESSDDAIISKDLNGIITSWNCGAQRLFGYVAEEVIGKPVTILMPPERLNEEPSILERIRRGEHIDHYETIRRRKDGRLVEISLTVSPIKDVQGKVIGASKIVRDITEQKRAERELQQAHHEVLAASRAKDDFLAALSHELRTPLNPVLLLASEAAEDPQLSAEIRALFTSIRNNMELQARLIDDLLDITRIAHGKLSITMDLVDAHALLKEAIATVRSELDQKRIALTMELAAEKHTVKGDAVRLQQVFWNVLKNAVKFTFEDGTISVGTHTKAETGEFVVTVTDNGIGMTSSELARIFEAFAQGEQVSAGGSHRFGGLGLGLAISRRLVELHSGRIRASSEGRDKGSIFIITLPLTREGDCPERSSAGGSRWPRSARERGLSTIHILLVEDHEPTRTALAHLLTRRHYEVHSAGSIAEARRLAGKAEFQLLISDIGLPDGNGFELMKELQASNKELRGIALTGYGMESDIARSREAGFASHLTKPVRVQSLEAALEAAVTCGT